MFTPNSGGAPRCHGSCLISIRFTNHDIAWLDGTWLRWLQQRDEAITTFHHVLLHTPCIISFLRNVSELPVQPIPEKMIRIQIRILNDPTDLGLFWKVTKSFCVWRSKSIFPYRNRMGSSHLILISILITILIFVSSGMDCTCITTPWCAWNYDSLCHCLIQTNTRYQTLYVTIRYLFSQNAICMEITTNFSYFGDFHPFKNISEILREFQTSDGASYCGIWFWFSFW